MLISLFVVERISMINFPAKNYLLIISFKSSVNYRINFYSLQLANEIFLNMAMDGSSIPPGSISICVSPLITPPPKIQTSNKNIYQSFYVTNSTMRY